MITLKAEMYVQDKLKANIMIGEFCLKFNQKYGDTLLTFVCDESGATLFLRKINHLALFQLRDILIDIINQTPEEVLEIRVLD